MTAAEFVRVPNVAVTVAAPTPTAVASPWLVGALLTVTTPVLLLLQVADWVTSCDVPSVNLAVAVNPSVLPCCIDAELGVTAMLAGMGAMSVRAVEVLTDPIVAVIVVDPTPTSLTSPWLPARLLIVATDWLDELQVTTPV